MRCNGRGVLAAALVVLCAGVSGCEGWKRADSTLALAGVWGVDTVEVNGRELIRMRSRHGEVDIDPRGGGVVVYRLMPPPRWRFEPSKSDPDEMDVKKIPVEGGPNVLAGEGWRTESGNEKRDLGMMWVVDGAPRELVLLGDGVDGLRWRKTYALSEAGELDLTVWLENVGSKELPVTARAGIETQGVDRYELHREVTDLVEADQVLKSGKHTAWTEHWRITRRVSATAPAAAP
ncbi:MAG: hypothetical protein K8S99_14345 [Planctomycetes bacterium]|nr:hypothetical protein [Planctomycetota bacterium]